MIHWMLLGNSNRTQKRAIAIFPEGLLIRGFPRFLTIARPCVPGVGLVVTRRSSSARAPWNTVGSGKEAHRLIVTTIQGAIAFYYFPIECEIGFDAATGSIVGQRTQRPLFANPDDTRGG